MTLAKTIESTWSFDHLFARPYSRVYEIFCHEGRHEFTCIILEGKHAVPHRKGIDELEREGFGSRVGDFGLRRERVVID